MAKIRDLRNRIKSVASTMKITRTMEMVATVRSKKVQGRLKGAVPFFENLASMAGKLMAAGSAGHPLLRKADKPARAALLVITSDRGLCGGYNTSAIWAARNELARYREACVEVELDVAGKKGIASFRFQRVQMHSCRTGLDDKVRFEDVEPMASDYIARFTSGELDEVRVVSFRCLSASVQKPSSFRLLPVEPSAGSADAREVMYDFLPGPSEILERLVPFEVKTALYTLFLEAGASEQISRRIAMKLATDNADEMIRSLRQKYNRARQGMITTELLDIIGGASGVEH